jgi:large subunit ribosomal protein L21
VRSGGKQHRVEPNQLLDVERLPAAVGDMVELLDVLLVTDGEEVTVGQPTVAGARVIAEVVEHGRDKKIVVFKYKAKTRYRKKIGHRQAYTRLAIRQILTGREPEAVAVAEAPAKPRQRRAPAKRVPKAAAKVKAEVAAEAVAEVAPVPAPEETPKPRPRRAPAKRAPKAEAEVAPEAIAEVAPEPAPEETPKPRPRRAPAKRVPKAEAEAAPEAVAEVAPEPAAEAAPPSEETAKPSRRRATKAEKAAEEAPPTPKRRARRGE